MIIMATLDVFSFHLGIQRETLTKLLSLIQKIVWMANSKALPHDSFQSTRCLW